MLTRYLERVEGRLGWRFAAALWVWMCHHRRTAAVMGGAEVLLVAGLTTAAIRGRLGWAGAALTALLLLWVLTLSVSLRAGPR